MNVHFEKKNYFWKLHTNDYWINILSCKTSVALSTTWSPPIALSGVDIFFEDEYFISKIYFSKWHEHWLILLGKLPRNNFFLCRYKPAFPILNLSYTLTVFFFLIVYPFKVSNHQQLYREIWWAFDEYSMNPRKLRIWSHLPEKPLMENFIFCAAFVLDFSWIIL